MVNSRNKLLSFLLGLGLSIFSWVILFVYLILKIAPFSQFGLFNIDAVGFFFTSLFLTLYSFSLLFKVRNITYVPILLIILHISTLSASALALFFVLIDLAILILINTGGKSIDTSNSNTWQYTYTSNPYNNNKSTNDSPNTKLGQDDVFDVEYSTKED